MPAAKSAGATTGAPFFQPKVIMRILKPGTEVKLLVPGGERVPAIVTAATIRRHDHVVYECVFWNGLSRSEVWVSPIEIMSTETTERIAIGFSNGETK